MRGAAWVAAAVALAPTLAMVAVHLFLHAPSLEPTGFLQYDQAYYMANAREHFDGGFHLLYGLPFSDDPQTPRIYFQPHLFLLGVVHHVTALPPGWLYLTAGLAAALGCLRVLAALLAGATGVAAGQWRFEHWLAWLLLCWGGGVLALVGVAAGLGQGDLTPKTVLRFDPEDGWWFLNLGRNFLYAVESYYHLLSFAVVLCLWRQRWAWAVALLLLVAASHPFTGVKMLLVVLAWALLERVYLRRPEVPGWLAAALGAILAGHLGYYMVFLGQSEEHRVLVAYWKSMPWPLPLGNALLAFALVGWFAWRRLRGEGRAALGDPRTRLWGVMALVTLALAKHDLVIEPHQPIHFVRGYLYVSLFFLGLPALLETLRRLRPRPVLLAGLVAVFLSDNAVWYAAKTAQAAAAAKADERFGWYMSEGERALFASLNREADPNALLIADSIFTAYLAQTFTPSRAWFSHRFNTPHAEARWESLNAFFKTGAMPPAWEGRRLVIAAGRHWWDNGPPPWWDAGTMRRLADCGDLVVIDRPAATPPGWNAPAGSR